MAFDTLGAGSLFSEYAPSPIFFPRSHSLTNVCAMQKSLGATPADAPFALKDAVSLFIPPLSPSLAYSPELTTERAKERTQDVNQHRRGPPAGRHGSGAGHGGGGDVECDKPVVARGSEPFDESGIGGGNGGGAMIEPIYNKWWVCMHMILVEVKWHAGSCAAVGWMGTDVFGGSLCTTIVIP